MRAKDCIDVLNGVTYNSYVFANREFGGDSAEGLVLPR